MRIRVVDSVSGVRLRENDIEIDLPHITLREIVRERVAIEVAAFNRTRPDVYYGLVEPAEAERLLNGYRVRRLRDLDADEECSRALRAFASNGFLVFAGGRQVESLDEELDLATAAEVEFVKLVPLMGGSLVRNS